MRTAVLFSGGKDSSLSALMLSKYFEVELLTFTFGLSQNWRSAERSAKRLGLPHKKIDFGSGVIEEATDMMIKDAFPRNGLNLVHKKALEIVANRRFLSTSAKEYEIIADGTRRDDISPQLTLAEVRSLEDSYGVHYVRPLLGFGRKLIDELAGRFFIVSEGENLPERADYEGEIRCYMRENYDEEMVEKIFPSRHVHSRVLGLKSCRSFNSGATFGST
ncbi:MAG: alpha hydrolase [Candidatus Methanolliviera hydrocarbonicum]|jgi:Predicted subunit of tRNA(5-methylaminomethyl-2-thiouridylate) methyltransferase, contains the PP-loop ATPase domain|uniref:Alpha hydrolase n=1 Tax=Candidatus Methanolliviera hydrocarbonicum TaxID=2491085 RepID=A0A520KWM0_9EURY|nr:MAG: alpha hydrolase [Candidatus Methanolliviera hydrocarbonicum]